MVLAVATFKWL